MSQEPPLKNRKKTGLQRLETETCIFFCIFFSMQYDIIVIPKVMNYPETHTTKLQGDREWHFKRLDFTRFCFELPVKDKVPPVENIFLLSSFIVAGKYGPGCSKTSFI